MTKKSDKDTAREAAAEREQALAQADADFREDVAKAAAKRQKVLDKYPDQGNIAERAWNATKSEDDVEYKALAGEFKQKLDDVVTAVRETGNADVVGLEEFEAEVVRLLAELDVPTGTALVPSGPGREAADEAAAESTDASAKRGKLPEDFPHKAELDAAGYDTYAKVRKLGGDYTEVAGVGEARGKEIDAAL
jgi:hypothetical protein